MQIRRLSVCAFLVLSALLGSAPAQQTITAQTTDPSPNPQPMSTAVQRDATAMALLGQCSQAMGAPTSTSNYLLKGQITTNRYPDQTGQITIEHQGYSQMRTNEQFSNAQETIIVNNGQMWASRNSVVLAIANWEEWYFRPDAIPALTCSIDVARPTINVKYVGLESIGNEQVHHIEFTAVPQQLADGSQSFDPVISDFHVYLDATSLNVVKTKRYVFEADALSNHLDYETYYDNYQIVNGVLMPFHVRHFLAGQLNEDITLTSFEPNAVFQEQDFTW